MFDHFDDRGELQATAWRIPRAILSLISRG